MMEQTGQATIPVTPKKSASRHPIPASTMSEDSRSPRRSSRVKKNPSVTPNRFNKFFQPRLKPAKKNSVKTSRKALQNLSAANLNSRLRGSQVSPTEEEQEGPKLKKRRLSFSSVLSLPSSPIRGHDQPLSSQDSVQATQKNIISDTEGHEDTRLDESDNGEETSDEEADLPIRPRISRYPQISSSAGQLSRQLGRRGIAPIGNESRLWQHETAGFYSLPGDIFKSANTNHRSVRSLPFSVASFHQQESVAIGNEDGQIEIYRAWARMPNYDHTLRSECRFIPHDNAIMDMEFSPDDSFLATGSGDQTCRIIDMHTRTGTHTLVGHEGSIKNVRWQPGSGNNILATCSRDGSVCLWDLRCAQIALSQFSVKPLSRAPHFLENSRKIPPMTEIFQAHNPYDKMKMVNGKRLADPLSSRADFAVTACAFISETRPHMLATASESNSIVKLWDMRASYKQRTGRPVPVSATDEPESHKQVRPFGVTSIVMSTDGSRMYTLCRDNTIYAYSTAHLVLGGASEMSSNSTQAFKSSSGAGTGLGPLYGFRHDRMKLGSFYDKLTIRPKTDENTEMLAAGTGEDCAVLFPTDERYLNVSGRTPFLTAEKPTRPRTVSRPALSTRSTSQIQPSTSFSLQSSQSSSSTGATPIYYHGTPLLNAHNKEVTCCAWISGNGQLVTVADDYTSRCWYEDDLAKARELRMSKGQDVIRNKTGWAGVIKGWDDDEA